MNDKANKVIIESLHMKDRNPLGFTQPRGELVKPKALRSSIKRLFGVLGFQIKDILDTCTMGSHYGMFVNGLGFRVTVRTGKEVPGGEKIPMAVEKPGKIRTLPKLPLGLKADETDTYLEFKIGNSHYSHVRLPKSWHAIVDESKGRYLIVAGGPTKNKVGEFASRIRNLRKLNPYKGTGVRFAGENIVLREGKKQT
jgi:ribosomal protein L6P/L9E